MRSLAHFPTPRSAVGRLFLSVVAVLALTLTVLVAAPTPSAQAHGWISDPPSRQDLCYTGTVANCGPVQYEPWSVEAPKGSMQCSGGGRFSELDNESIAWPRQAVSTNQTFTWDIVANHSTSTWEYFVDGQLHTTIDDGGALPPDVVTHQISNLPEGNHKIFVRWNIADTVNAFYACIDAYITPGGTEPDPDPEPEPGECDVATWSPTTVYLGGDQASFDGAVYEAQWYTSNQSPADWSDQYEVWQQVRTC
ncbi:lytic polysaccharide monooxygenase [Myceligenerans cantabricum]